MKKNKQIYICIECKKGKAKFNHNLNSFLCNSCNNIYPIIDGVTLAIKDKSDFYNYKRKLRRYINPGNGTNI